MKALCLVLALALTACSATGALPYAATGRATPLGTVPVIGQVTATDDRGEPPRWIGAVRGGFGNPLKVIETTDPVGDEVALAFKDALARRGIYGAPGADTQALTVTIRKMDCSQYVRREAHADFEIVLTDHAGRTLYHDTVQVTVVEGSKLAMDVGIFGNPDDLRAVASQAMSKAIDQALDKPNFRAAVSDRPNAGLRVTGTSG
nr:hypothetical protein [uncultured Rhodopila sp.]